MLSRKFAKFSLFHLRKFARSSIGCTKHAEIESDEIKFFKDYIVPGKVREQIPEPKYGGESMVTLLTGSSYVSKQGGNYIKSLIRTAKVPIIFEVINIDQALINWEYEKACYRNRYAIHVDLQHDPEKKHQLLFLNNHLDLYACVVRCKSYEGYRCKYPCLDIMIIMENNVGDFSKLEYEPVKGVVETIRYYTDDYQRRYLNFVYKYAEKCKRRKITFAHKTSNLPRTDGKFLSIAMSLHEELDIDIEVESMQIDAVIRKLVMDPSDFDIICTTDRYGTVLATVCSAVCGDAALYSAVELGDTHAIFKPLQTKLSLTDGRELCPYGIVNSVIDLLMFLGKKKCAKMMKKQLYKTMIVDGIKTKEYGGKYGGDFVICHLVDNLKCSFA